MSNLSFGKEGQRNIGAIWEKTISNQPALSINIIINGEEVSLLAFRNNNKEPGDKRPDWNILPKKKG